MRCLPQGVDTRSAAETKRPGGGGSRWVPNLRSHRSLHDHDHVSVDMAVNEETEELGEKGEEGEEEEEEGGEGGEETSVHVRMFARPSGENWWVL